MFAKKSADIVINIILHAAPATPAPAAPAIATPAPAPAASSAPAKPVIATHKEPVEFVNVPKTYEGRPVHAGDIKTNLPKPASDAEPMRTKVPPQAPGAPALPRIVKKYTVVKGDTLGGIAQKHGLRTSELLRVNSMGDANKIRVGQVLNIPEPTPGAPRPVAPAAVTAPAGGSVHTVASGETIGGIAHKYGLKTGDVLRANGLTEESAKKIKVGQKIKIPAKTAANTYKAPDKSTARIDPAPSAPAAANAPAIRPVSVTAPAPAPAPAIRTPVVRPVAPADPAPAVIVPAVQTPAVTVPAVQTPAVTVPAVTVPAVQTPAVTVPAVSVPAVQTPTVSVAAPAAGAVRDYVVQAGDDLTTIAKSHNMSKTDLILLNGFSLDAEVTPGQTIKVK